MRNRKLKRDYYRLCRVIWGDDPDELRYRYERKNGVSLYSREACLKAIDDLKARFLYNMSEMEIEIAITEVMKGESC